MRALFENLFSIDARSLTLARLLFSLVLFWDFFERLPDIEAHYSDSGIYPRAINIIGSDPPWYHWSLWNLSGDARIAQLLFALHFAALCFLLVSRWSKLGIFIAYVFLTSLHNRNLYVLHGGDDIVRLFLFWNFFLPAPKENRYFSVASAALMVQVALVYVSTAALKTDVAWRSEGSALYYAYSLEPFTKDLGIYLLQFPLLLKFLTHISYLLESFAIVFAFSPWRTNFFRYAGVAIFVFFHLIAIGATMNVGLIGQECAIMWLIFLPSSAWSNKYMARLADFFEKVKHSPGEQRAPVRKALNAACGAFFALVVLWNAEAIIHKTFLPYPIRVVAVLPRLDQRWDMFSPKPSISNGWYVFPIRLRNGQKLDLLTGKPYTTRRPARIWMQYKSTRWLKYLTQLHANEHASKRQYYVHFMARQWNASHPPEEHIKSLELIFFFQPTPPPTQAKPEPRPILLFRWLW